MRVAGDIAGWLDAPRAERLARFDGVFATTSDGLAIDPRLETSGQRTAALDDVARALAQEGHLSPWRGERYAVAPRPGAQPWFLLERAAARYFGIATYAAHVNGLVRRSSGIMLWLARRSPAKAIDPGLLDNLVGGGIAAGQSVMGSVIKESWEEAGIPAALAELATSTGPLQVHREHADGLQRETIYVHDLWLPEDFAPQPQDGEVIEHRLVGLPVAAAMIALREGPDVVTLEASLVILDCLLRHGTITPDAEEFLTLAALRHPTTEVSKDLWRTGTSAPATCENIR